MTANGEVQTHEGVELDVRKNPILCRTTTNVLFFYIFFASVWRQAAVLPRRGHLFHDLITQIFLRSLQYGIVVMGVIDAFVYAHNDHRRNMVNLGNFGDCMKGRFRFMTAITPANAHAYQLICLTGHIPAALHSKLRLPAAKVRYPQLPNVRTKTRERGNDFGVGPSTLTGGTRFADGETLVGWGSVARSPHGRIYVMFGPVITTEAHFAFAGARVHCNNTAEMSVVVEPLSFLGPHAPSAVMRTLVFSMMWLFFVAPLRATIALE